MPSFGNVSGGPLEGREAELVALTAALDDACAGHGRVAVVTGEAGIGKSALVGKLAEAAAGRGVTVLWGRAWEFADAPSYFPLWPCLTALGIATTETRCETPFTLWEGVLAALSNATRAKPQLWLLEDLHAADLQTLDLLTFLAPPLRVLPVLVVLTARPRDPRLDERSEQRLLRMARDGLELRLGGLSVSDVERVARRHAGELAAPEIRDLYEMTGGNPLFVVECARAIRAGTFQARHGVSWTIRQVVNERLQLLAPNTRELLESAAVLGREFTAAHLSRLHGLLSGRVVDDLLPALRSGILFERAPGSYSFSHVVVHEATYAGISAERRSAWHARIEISLRASPESPESLLERARHALGSLTHEREADTLALVRRVGRTLEASGAFDRAHALYARLREKVAAGELTGPLSGRELLHLASVAERAGKSGESRALCLEVLGAARARDDHEELALAALELGRALRPGLIDEQLVVALREGLVHFADPASPLGCRLLARLAAALQPAPDPRGPVQMALDAIERARRIGDSELLLEVLDVAGSALVEYAPLEQCLRASEQLRELATAARDVPRLQRARARLALNHGLLGSFDVFEQMSAEMLREAEAMGQPQAKIRPLLMSSLDAVNHGRIAESDGLLAEAEQLLSLTDDAGLALSYRAHRLGRAISLHHDSELESAQSSLPRWVQGLPDAKLILPGLRGAIRARLEQLELAREDVRAAWANFGPSAGGFIHLIAEAAAFAGEREVSARCHALLLPRSGQEALGGHVSVTYDGPVDRLLGLLEAALGDHAIAETRLRSVLALAERRNFQPWIAQGRYDLAKLLARLGRGSEARSLFQSAAMLAETCEMKGLVVRASARLSGAPLGAAVAEPHSARHAPALRMKREGDLYLVERGEHSVRVRATRGAELLARLVEAPDREIHVLALASDEAGGTIAESNSGDSLDKTALRQYRGRLKELDALLDRAEATADRGRAEALRSERAAVERELGRALGLGGRVRQTGSNTERARVNVQRRLKDTLERITEASPELGAWLTRSVRTGTYCSFSSKPSNS